MLCWSCQKEVSETAKFCPHCEAENAEEPTLGEKKVVEGMLANMTPELANELRDAFEKSTTGEDFVNRVMIGDCPTCGGSKTGDCEHDPEINNSCVARCFDCAQLWCPDCGEFFKAATESAEHDCPAWDDTDFDDDDPDFDDESWDE